MALLTEKENNESYTFGQMLKQPDAADFIHAMIKEADDHESRDESPILEDTANNDNGHINFDDNSSMPSIINLATTGL